MPGAERSAADSTNTAVVAGKGAKRRRGNDGAALTPIEWHGDTAVRDGVPLWSFDQASQEQVPSSSSKDVEEPTPAAELRRAELLKEVRECYDAACSEIMGLEQPPADSVDRWLLEMLAQPRGTTSQRDPLLAKPRIAESSRVLLRELLAEVPLRCPTRAYGRVARDAICRYRDSAELWLDRLGDKATALRGQMKELQAWLDGTPVAVGRTRHEDCVFKQKLVELSKDGGFSSRLRPLVEPLALQVIGRVSSAAEQVAVKLVSPTQQAEDSIVHLEDSEARGTALRFGTDRIVLSSLHFRKLRALYLVHSGPRPSSSEESTQWDRDFHRRLYVMARRYVTFIGLDPDGKGLKGGNMHAAAPEPVFAWLQEELHAHCECFASPLNCYFSSFYSAFPDVDMPFGSRGSFFDAEDIVEGSYEVGPPYTEELLELTARRLMVLLQRSGTRPLSFVLFVPDWEGAAGLTLIEGASFDAYRRTHHGAYALARGREHHYISGIQFFADAGDDASRRYYVVPHGTRVYVLQNEVGAKKWPFTQARERDLLAKMRP